MKNDDKSYRLGYLLYHSKMPESFKDAFLSLLPSMSQDQLKELYKLLESADKIERKYRMDRSKQWERMKFEHEVQVQYFLDRMKES